MTEEQLEEIARRAAEIVKEDPAWWEIAAALGPFAVLLGAVATLWIGLASVRRQRLNAENQSADNRDAIAERRRADDRAEWWKRVQWALDASMSGSAVRQDLGFKMLKRLTQAGNIDKEDLELLEPSWLRTVAASGSKADEALDDTAETLQDMVNQGLIDDDYLHEYRRIMDDQAGEEHNGTDTADREASDERNP